jgi:glucuronosyltransferase
MTKLKGLLCTLVLLLNHGNCANILFLHGVISPSHHIWNGALARGLANRGHNVTFLSVNEAKVVTQNLHYIVLDESNENFEREMQSVEAGYDIIKYTRDLSKNQLKLATTIPDYGIKSCRAMMKSKNGFEKLLSYPSGFVFELVIHDFTCGPCLLPVIHKFNYPPVVGVSAFLNPPYTDLTIGGHKYPGYVPHYITNYRQVMGFAARIFNSVLYGVEKL